MAGEHTARRFRLPDIQDLSKDQERARLLPKTGKHLIVGGPGTGKSIIALLRSRRLHEPAAKAQDYVFLAYNRLLIAASRELMDSQVAASTWIAWFKEAYQRTLQAPCPVRDGKQFLLDWYAIGEALERLPDEIDEPVPAYLIVDEGQDMPPAFYENLIELGFEHFFVVADQNQEITDDHSKISQIADALMIKPEERIYLSENYRNSIEVARLAQCFCVDEQASPKPRLPERRSSQVPLLVDYGGSGQPSFEAIITRVLRAADRQPARLFGVITHNNNTRQRWLNALRGARMPLDHGQPRIATFVSGQAQGDLRFGKGGIFVITWASAKGLEFDSVILADINEYRYNPDAREQVDELRRRFYVMISRARERVVILRRSDALCPADAILPDDPNLLRLWRPQ